MRLIACGYVGIAFLLTSTAASAASSTSLFSESKLSGGQELGQFGFAVAISGDTLLMAAPLEDVEPYVDVGSVYVYVRTGATWTQQALLTPNDPGANDEFGFAVALNGDTAVIGAPLADTVNGANAGAAYVFVRNGTTWTQQAKLVTDD